MGTVQIGMRMLGGVDVLDLSGKVTLDGHRRLKQRFQEAIDGGRKRFILNLRDVTALDSMTLGEVVACFKRARERGGDVRLVVVPDGIVHGLLQMTGLDRILQIYGDEAEAAASFSAAGA